ncbi:hypothetical protein HG536_0G00700 [Torulaspora globosa]|uniref:STB6-like N-terminal domain-containing protein n=1 Tax=Torulaspora globosa TaxID=48254 RepID=A0A7G3ZL27_9SACH|nr:uncharacterized protein HG536_0G00700 [Torulaspora globosa]QLL34213.1 hypothetical protein HG536_0G00700 [Torulaspora globosa]
MAREHARPNDHYMPNVDTLLYKPLATEPLASFIFPDFGALHALRLESFVNLNFQEIDVNGFEIYIVEQWATERKISTVITSYTGNSQDTIRAVQVALPEDPRKWPAPLRNYHDNLVTFAQAKVMSKGTLFITNLPSVPSNLNLLHVECGDVRVIWRNFEVNLDLKRLQCGGRSALLLCASTKAAEDKFSQLYKISMCPISREQYLQCDDQDDHGQYAPMGLAECYHPVIELITLVQIALGYFDLFHHEKDGLLCNDTISAINRWWNKYGKFYLGVERLKNEGPLGPTTTTALISLVLSCYFKMKVEDCAFSKDPFEETPFRNSIHAFQKKYGIGKGSGAIYLDDKTLEKLFEVSAKTSNTDIFKFKKVVKSTVQDIAGRGNPMHLSNEVLTTDLDSFVKHIHGGSLGLLWKSKGRPRRRLRNIREHLGMCDIKYFRGDPDALLEKQAIYFLEMKAHGADSQNSSDGQEKTLCEANKLMRYDSSGSSISASSMFCNYDKSKYARNFGINKVYHEEYIRRHSFPYADDGTHDTFDDDDDSCNKQKAHCLYRSDSVSQVQDVIETWRLPFDPSLVKMARDLLRIRYKLEAQQRVDEMMHGYMGKLELNGDCTTAFSDLMSDLESVYHSYSQNLGELDEKKKGTDTKQALLRGEMRELNSLSSKFQYDMRVLKGRMRDVEDSVNHFETKLMAMQKSLVEQGLGIATAVDSLSDKVKFDKCVSALVQEKDTKYEGICLKMFSKRFVRDVKEDVSHWGSWFFTKLFYRHGNTDNGIK